jgi:hypothetical protein
VPWEVRTDLPYGNACGISVEKGGTLPVVRFAADPKGSPEALWFCLRIQTTSTREGRGRVKLVLEHVDNMLGVSDLSKIRPVFRPGKDGWRRMPPPTQVARPDGHRECEWVLDEPGRLVDLALCYPYGPPELEQLVDECGGYWKQDTIGLSQGGRPLIRLSNHHLATEEAPGIFLVSRQHSGETPGSWVLDGLLRSMAEAGDGEVLFWAVPLANIDGVMEGFYGKDNYPYDLNRAWGDPPMRHEVLACRRDISRFIERCHPILGIDFHAPGCCESGGMYAFLPKPDVYPDQHNWANTVASMMERALGEEYAAEPFGRVAKYASRWETPGFASHCCRLGFPALSIETPYSEIRDRVLTVEDYREAGRRISLAVRQLLQEGAGGG